MKQKNRGKKFFANRMHRQLFGIIFLAAVIPTLFATISLFYLIFKITADQMAFPEAIAYNILPAAKKVLSILQFALPISIIAILIIAHKLTHTIVGPYDRIVRELDECLHHERTNPIIIRQKDKFRPLVDRINLLLSKMPD